MAARYRAGAFTAVALHAAAILAGGQIRAAEPLRVAAGHAETPSQGAAPAAPIVSPGPSAARYPKTTDEFDAYFTKVSNWGRWGQADELGTLNLITDAKRKQAASLVKAGQSVWRIRRSPICRTTAAPSSTR
jgi:hypothetical protein